MGSRAAECQMRKNSALHFLRAGFLFFVMVLVARIFMSGTLCHDGRLEPSAKVVG